MTDVSTRTDDPRVRARDERMSRRIMRDGRWYAPEASHGVGSAGYQYWGCRCEPCTRSASALSMESRKRRRSLRRLVASETPLPVADRALRDHERAEAAARRREEADARRDLLVEVDGRMVTSVDVPHGTQNTYSHWCCRCEPCTAAARNASRHKRQQTRGNDLVRMRSWFAERYGSGREDGDA